MSAFATLGIVRRGDDVLLGTKGTAEIGTGKVNAGGGKCEQGETLERCLARELDEEFGITVKPEDLTLTGVLHCYAGGEFFQYVFVYGTDVFTGEPIETPSMTPLWIHKDELPFERMHEGDRHWFKKAVNGEKFRVAIFYERPGEGYITHHFLEF